MARRRVRVGAAALLLLGLGLWWPVAARAAGKDFVGQRPPEIQAGRWLNTEPLTLAALRGRVVLLEFWSPG